MDMFGKATKAVKEVGGSVIDSAKNFGTSIYSSSKEQGELAGMKVQKSVIEKRLQDSYAEIGKRYISYMNSSDGSDVFDVSDIVEKMKPELDKLAEIEEVIAEKELNAKKEEQQRQLKKAQDEFEAEKAKLDKALSMDILTQEEYDEKMAVVQKKLDNYDQLRRIDLQLQMGIITYEEHAEKVDKLLM